MTGGSPQNEHDSGRPVIAIAIAMPALDIANSRYPPVAISQHRVDKYQKGEASLPEQYPHRLRPDKRRTRSTESTPEKQLLAFELGFVLGETIPLSGHP
jgi:hypothetical protein